MNYNDKLQNVSVLGAAGKMGSGIVLLTLLEMTDLSLQAENKSRTFVLNAIDISQKSLTGLVKYLGTQIVKVGEKKIMLLRQLYKDREDLIENGEIIQQYVIDALSLLRPVTDIKAAYESELVFEAASENPQLKNKLFKQINENSKKDPWFLTNTSSIPISELDGDANLGGRIIGFHFYNPPAVQRLIEIIEGNNTLKELSEFSVQYAKKLRKVIVSSNDIAGFIGNGHFMRDANYGMDETMMLNKKMPFTEAVYIINKVSQELLVRPMGIFQLIDYVGVDVCQYIMMVMNPYAKDETIHSDLLDQFMELDVKGGQNSDGSQKDGFLKYENDIPVGIYDPDQSKYVSMDEIAEKCDQYIGEYPESFVQWKSVVNLRNNQEILSKFFNDLKEMDTNGAKLALNYLKNSKEIGLKLVSSKVAKTDKDVNTVLLTGFFHAYGPINDFI